MVDPVVQSLRGVRVCCHGTQLQSLERCLGVMSSGSCERCLGLVGLTQFCNLSLPNLPPESDYLGIVCVVGGRVEVRKLTMLTVTVLLISAHPASSHYLVSWSFSPLDPKACENFCTLPFYSQFVDVMFHIHSAGSVITREAATVLVKSENRSRSECTGVLSS